MPLDMPVLLPDPDAFAAEFAAALLGPVRRDHSPPRLQAAPDASAHEAPTGAPNRLFLTLDPQRGAIVLAPAAPQARALLRAEWTRAGLSQEPPPLVEVDLAWGGVVALWAEDPR